MRSRAGASPRRRGCLGTVAAFVALLATVVGAALVAAPQAHTFIPAYEPVWANTIDYGVGLDDELVEVIVAPDGSVSACGSGYATSGYADLCLARITSNWRRTYKYRWDKARRYDRASALVRARDGSIYTVGSSETRATGSDLVVIKWPPLGKVVWG